MQQKRLILALVLSSAILFAWSYFYPVTPPETPQPSASASPSPSGTAAPQEPGSQSSATPQPGNQPASSTPQSSASQRILTVRTPLYEIKFDTRGAQPISWIIKRNKTSESEKEIFSVAGKATDRIPLQLISPEGLKRHQVPLQLLTGDAAFDAGIGSATYEVTGIEGIATSGDIEVNIAANEKKEITFTLTDGTGTEVKKSLVFDGNTYSTDLVPTIKRSNQVVPEARVTIGPSIGDQGLGHHTFYSVAPEAIAFVGGSVERHLADAINGNNNSPDLLRLNGPVSWAGVADTYFGMVAVPLRETTGLEYRTVAYEYKPEGGSPEKRFLITGFVPIPTDGTKTVIFAGPKDHYLLSDVSAQISAVVSRPIDLEGLIDYGFGGKISRPIAVPILKAISYLHKVTNSYGVAIILFTIVIYSLFFPLKWRSSKSMKKAQKLAPKMKELQEKIKGMKQNDPRLKELQMEQLRLMKEGNPLGGCLPLLVQMPFLFALYRAITISLDFRQASFLWIPDLSAPEPYLIHVLPILMTGTMVVLQLVTPAPSADPLQRKMMAIGMPLFMLYILWSAPSGLVLYWLVGNIVGFTQQFLINRWTKTDDDPAPSPAPTKKAKASSG